MSTKHLLAEELHSIVDVFPATPLMPQTLDAFRRAGAENLAMGDPQRAGVVRSEIFAASAVGPDVRCLLYVPENNADVRPGYLHVHGGGYVMGSPEGSDLMNLAIASKLGAVVVSVDYRLAPENCIPAPLDDCYAGLAWLYDHASDYKVDTNRIGVGGESAGGGLAAALAIKARDAGEYSLCHQHLTYPMLDNLTGSESCPGDPFVGEFVWTRERNLFGWESYLGDAPAEAPQVPARVADFSGLPPTWMMTASLDLFRDENIAYAQGLLAAGIPAELIVYEGACHGFQMVQGTELGRRYVRDHMDALARGLGIRDVLAAD